MLRSPLSVAVVYDAGVLTVKHLLTRELHTPMTDTSPLFALEHPELGQLPARRVLDCVFALAPDGKLLHFHAEQMTLNAAGDLELTAQAPDESRARCRVIPPFVVAFRPETT